METTQSQSQGRAVSLAATAGLLCALGGAGWLVVGLVSLVMLQPTGAGYSVSQVFWILIQTLLLVGVLGLAFSGAVSGHFAVIAVGVALIGRLDFIVAEVDSLIIGEESVLLPVGALVTAIGMTLVGIAVLRAGRWSGWRRYTPLIAGVYPFVGMFPFIFISEEPNMVAIALWGIAWAAFGCALYLENSPNADEREGR